MFLQWWRNRRSLTLRAGKQTKRPGRCRPGLEILEERAVPTVSAISLNNNAVPSSVTPDGMSGNAAVSADGRYVVYQSNATNIVPGETNPSATNNLYLYDRVTRTTSLITHSTISPNIVGNGDSTSPVISASGQYIAFQTTATNLIAGVSYVSGSNSSNVLLFDRVTGGITLVSRGNAGGTTVVTGDATSFGPVISSDGNYVAFVSLADNLVSGGESDTNTANDVFLFSRIAGSIFLVSRTPSTTTVQAGNNASMNPTINSDGSFVAYQSLATNLAAGLTISAGTSQVFLYSRATQANTLISHDAVLATSGGNGASTAPSLSGDGSLVVYPSAATDLVAGQVETSPSTNVFEYSNSAATNLLVSHSTSGNTTAGNGASDQPVISANGQSVVYRSAATNLVSGQTEAGGATNVFLYNNAYSDQSVRNTMVSRIPTSATAAGDGSSGTPAVSGNGDTVVFTSTSTDLVNGETKADGSGTDVYAYNLVIGSMRLVSTALGFSNMTGSGSSDQPLISSDGSFVAFRSAASNLISGDLNSQPDVFGFVNHTDSLVAEVTNGNQIYASISNGFSFLPQTVAVTLPAGQYTQPLIGDFNGDDHQDIAVRDLNTGNWYVALSNAVGGFLAPTLWDRWTAGNVWADVMVGDFDGQGLDEIAGRFLATGAWYVDQSTGSQFHPVFWTIWAPDSPSLTWTDVMAGDVTGEGRTDIVGRVLQSGQWWVAQSTGTSFLNFLWTTWSPDAVWVDVHLVDLNGDGKADIVGRTRDAAQWWAGLSNGSKFINTLWATWSNQVVWTNVVFGDFNGDGKIDVAGQVQGSGQWWVGISNGAKFTTALWTIWPPSETWVDVQAGDFNGDGYADIAGRDQATGQWQVAISNGSTLFSSSVWSIWDPTVAWTGVRHGAFV